MRKGQSEGGEISQCIKQVGGGGGRVKGGEGTWIVQSEYEAGGWRDGHIEGSRMKGVGCREV